MKKRNIFLALAMFVLLAFNSTNASFADNFTVIPASDADVPNRYINFADTFTGYDKFESFNRKMFKFNLGVNKVIVRPVSIVWASVMPQAGMDRLNNFYDNLNYPLKFFGCAFQKDWHGAKIASKRFWINTTRGWVGFYDVATSKYHLDAQDEDMTQVLAHYNVKSGPYLVLPFVAQGKNIREMSGKFLNTPFQPTTYIAFGSVTAISSGVSMLNSATLLEPITILADTYADPYEVSRQLFGLDTYLKVSNLDRNAVYNQKVAEQKNLINVSYKPENEVHADVKLNHYNPQGPVTDALRTLIFDNQKVESSKWSDMSLWNKTFINKLKIGSVKSFNDRAKYKFKYVLQKDKNAPLAIIYPSIGEGIWSNESFMQAKIMYDKGYSVVILGSAFSWEFVKSMPESYRPGLPFEDAKLLRKLTLDVILKLQDKNNCEFRKKVIVGTSFGGITALFVDAEESTNNQLGVSDYITINPPVELFYALQQIDEIITEGQRPTSDLKEEMGLTAQKVMKVSASVQNKSITKHPEGLPFTQKEAELAISYALRQKLSDVVYTVENSSQLSKDEIYKKIDNMNFYDYANEYLIPTQHKSIDELSYDASLHSIESFLKTSNNYKIYHSTDDFFTNSNQIKWLKQTAGNKAVLFDNGSHLGFLYRKEFISRFEDDLTRIKNGNL